MGKEKICYTNTYTLSSGLPGAGTVILLNFCGIWKEKKMRFIFFCPQIYDNLISDEEIELDFPISHHDISVMELADQ